MRWHYTFVKHEGPVYVYAYGREDSPVDGQITYSEVNQRISVKPCSIDREFGKYALEDAEEHFWKVIREGFPKERQVDCG